jgi:hypothetical protein
MVNENLKTIDEESIKNTRFNIHPNGVVLKRKNRRSELIQDDENPDLHLMAFARLLEKEDFDLIKEHPNQEIKTCISYVAKNVVYTEMLFTTEVLQYMHYHIEKYLKELNVPLIKENKNE